MFPQPEDTCASHFTQGPPPHARVLSGSRTAAAHPRRPWSPAARACGCFRVPPQAAAATPVVDTNGNPFDAARGAPKTRASDLRARVRIVLALIVVCACLSRVVPAAAPPSPDARGGHGQSFFGGETNCADER